MNARELCGFVCEKMEWLDGVEFYANSEKELYRVNAVKVLQKIKNELQDAEYRVDEWRLHYLKGVCQGAIEVVERFVDWGDR